MAEVEIKPKKIERTMTGKSEPNIDFEEEENSLKDFGILLLILEVIMIALLWVFARDTLMNPNDLLLSQRYPGFQDVNVMMLVGFGFLMTFIRSYAWSSIAYTFFTNAFIFQIYILLYPFWAKVFNHAPFSGSGVTISLDIYSMILCSYAVASVLVAYGGVIGRCGPKDLLIIAIVHIIGYSLNERIVFFSIGMVDGGCSSTIHTYGAYYGLTVCLVLARQARPITNIKISYVSNIFAFIGTLFLWLYYPSFNYASLAVNPFEQNLIVVNTIMSLGGSVLATYIVSALGFGRGLEMENILNATISGGVVMGAPCSFIYRPGLAAFIGFTTGAISTWCFHNLTPKLLDWIGLYDTCGIHNLHGIPGLLGGIWSAIVVAFYNTGYDMEIAAQYSNGHFLFPSTNSFLKQGGLQIAGTFCSFGMSIAFGLVGGLLVSCFYKEKPKYFYLDTEYFENAHFREIYREDMGDNLYLDQKAAAKKLAKEEKEGKLEQRPREENSRQELHEGGVEI